MNPVNVLSNIDLKREQLPTFLTSERFYFCGKKREIIPREDQIVLIFLLQKVCAHIVFSVKNIILFKNCGLNECTSDTQSLNVNALLWDE